MVNAIEKPYMDRFLKVKIKGKQWPFYQSHCHLKLKSFMNCKKPFSVLFWKRPYQYYDIGSFDISNCKPICFDKVGIPNESTHFQTLLSQNHLKAMRGEQ